MKKHKKIFDEFINKIKKNDSGNNSEDSFLDELKDLTSHESVEEMINRFSELADIDRE